MTKQPAGKILPTVADVEQHRLELKQRVPNLHRTPPTPASVPVPVVPPSDTIPLGELPRRPGEHLWVPVEPLYEMRLLVGSTGSGKSGALEATARTSKATDAK